MIRFIDRWDEMGLLESSWVKDNAEFVVICGRRRIGKTRLILEFMKDKDGIFFIAEDTNKKAQINELKNKIAGYFNDDFLRRTDINEWRDLFEYLTKILPSKKRIYFTVDEFSYIIKNDPAIVSALQKFWDTFLSNTKIFFLISGSLFGLMSEKVLSSASPLYGRRTRDLLITPLTFKHSLEFLNMSFTEKMKVYMGIGGIPEYLLKVRDYKNSTSFFTKEFFNKNGYFYREPYFLLSQEFKEIKTYFTILNAVAYGSTKPTEIANFAGLNTKEIYPYLENLIRLGFIERVTPIIGKRKSGIYFIRDVFFDFWFNFVYGNRESIEKNEGKIDESKLNTYFGKRFESLIRDEIAYKILKFPRVGRWWYKDKEIDIVGINEKTKEIIFGECKWKDNVNAEKVLQELKEKSKFVDWNTDKRKESYAIFAKSFKKRIKDCYCFDLKDVSKHLYSSKTKMESF